MNQISDLDKGKITHWCYHFITVFCAALNFDDITHPVLEWNPMPSCNHKRHMM